MLQIQSELEQIKKAENLNQSETVLQLRTEIETIQSELAENKQALASINAEFTQSKLSFKIVYPMKISKLKKNRNFSNEFFQLKI